MALEGMLVPRTVYDLLVERLGAEQVEGFVEVYPRIAELPQPDLLAERCHAAWLGRGRFTHVRNGT